MTQCPACGAEWHGTNFCANCGKDLRHDPLAESKSVRASISSELDLFRIERLPSGSYKVLGLIPGLEADVSHLKIPDCVEIIGESAFLGNTRILSVEIGNGVKVIETRAFQNCKKLSAVTLGSGLRFIGSAAFSHCVELPRLHVPANVVKIGDGAFLACTRLEELTVERGLELIGALAFLECKGLEGKEICIPAETICKWMSFSDNVRVKRVDG